MQADPSRHDMPHPGEPKRIAPPSDGFRVWHFMMLILACALAFTLFAAWPLLIVAMFIGVIAMFIGAIVIVSGRRTSQQDALLDVLAIAADRGVPLGPAVEAVADSCGGRYRRWAETLAGLLNSGVSLPDALDRVPRILPPDAKLLIRVGGESGLLPVALREASAARRSRELGRANPLPNLVYLIAVLVAMQVITGFLLYFIIPKFEVIFHDFGVGLPMITIFVIRASHFVANTQLLALLVLGEVVLLFHLPFAYYGWSIGHLPWIDRLLLAPFDRLLVRRHSSLILRALARGIEVGKPLTALLNTLVQYHPSTWVRGRLVRVRDDVRKGVDGWKSLRDHGLIRPADAAVLEAANRVGNLPWALRMTAESGERRLGYRLQMWLQLLFPAVVLAMGGLVGLLVAAFFLPLVTLIRAMAS